MSISFARRALVLACAVALLTASAGAQVAVLGATIHERTSARGESYDGTITIENTTAAPQDARLYRTDYRFFADGGTLFEPAGSTPRSNAGWISIASEWVTIPAGQSVTVPYRVMVPATASAPLTGTYWSTIMVEGSGSPSGSSVARGEALVLRSTTRHAVQVVTHIEGSGIADVRFESPAVSVAPDGSRAFVVDLTNAGERAGRLQLTLELFDAAGRSVGTFRQRGGLVYPGTSRRPQFTLGALPGGEYTALLMADAGGDAVYGAQYTLKF